MVLYKSVQDGPFCFSTTQCKIRGESQMGKCCLSAKKKKRKWIQAGRFLLLRNYLRKRSALLTEYLAIRQEKKCL